jgi:spore coat protein U-like protein
LQNAARMMKRLSVILILFALPALAQVDPLRNVSGTTPNPGFVPWETSASGGWTFFEGFNAHLTYVSETGPEEQRNEAFSTNWVAIGAQRTLGSRGFVLLRGRASLEPFTIADNDGYPQMLQYVSAESGGVLVDRMRPQDLIGEAALHAGIRLGGSSLISAYAAVVGDPALGTAPFALRASGADFAEAPFAYDIQEPFHDATSVVTLGFASRILTLEGSVFHEAVTFGDHTEIDNGDIDSSSARITLTPSPNVAIQVSRGTLGEDAAERKVSTASIAYGTERAAATALWTRRERDGAPTETAYGFELTFRGARSSVIGRAEWVDRPSGFPDTVTATATEQTTHFAVGYIFDFLASSRLRAGAGVNIDYHTQSHELPPRYGHKPQAVYAFVRLKSGRL